VRRKQKREKEKHSFLLMKERESATVRIFAVFCESKKERRVCRRRRERVNQERNEKQMLPLPFLV
jgi:hypothetical protein